MREESSKARRGAVRAMAVLVLAGRALGTPAAPEDHKPSGLTGIWRGASTCVDLVAAPACRDEVVVYDFTMGAKPGSVHWKADKVVNGQRELMYEIDLVYDAANACWAAEFGSPRGRGVWCLVAEGAHLTGTC